MCKSKPSHLQWPKELPSPQNLWMDHDVHPQRKQQVSCKPSLPHSQQHQPSDKIHNGGRGVKLQPSASEQNNVLACTETHIFFFQVKEVVNGFIHQFWATYDSHKVRVGSSSRGKPEINLKKGYNTPQSET